MATLLRRTIFLFAGFLALQTASGAFAQGRMGMMMARQQMMMNAGMTGPFNTGLSPWIWNSNLYGNRLGYPGYGGYGGGYGYSGYGGSYSSDYSGGDSGYSNSYRRPRSYADETPPLSPQEERERIHQIELAWSQGELSELETQSGAALNILLADLRDMQSRGIQTSDISLDQETLRHINVLMGRSNGNPGLFKDNGRLSWPLVLRSPGFQRERDLINSLAPQVIEQARQGRVTNLGELAEAVHTIQGRLYARIHDISAPEYIGAKRFLTQLADVIKLLYQPDAGKYFDQTYAARGKTAGELVRYMTQMDLRFAPAAQGDEPAYRALHQILAAYDRAAHSQVLARN